MTHEHMARRRRGRETYNLEEHLACGEGLALLLLPGRNATLGHGRTHCWHVEGGQRISACGEMETWKEA